MCKVHHLPGRELGAVRRGTPPQLWGTQQRCPWAVLPHIQPLWRVPVSAQKYLVSVGLVAEVEESLGYFGRIWRGPWQTTSHFTQGWRLLPPGLQCTGCAVWGGLKDGCPPHPQLGCGVPAPGLSLAALPCGHGSQKTLPGWERAGSRRAGQSSATAGLRHPGGPVSLLLTPTPRDTIPGGYRTGSFLN